MRRWSLCLLAVACGPRTWSTGGSGPMPDPPPEVVLEVSDPDTSEVVAGGGVLLQAYVGGGESWILAVDPGGSVRFSHTPPSGLRAIRAHLGRDESSILVLSTDPTWEQRAGRIQRLDFAGRLLSETTASWAHHDFVELDDGLAWIAHRYEDVVIPPDTETTPLAADQVRFAPEGSTNDGDVLFDFLTDYVPPWWVCPHMQDGQWLPDRNEWTHSNSLVRHPSDGSLLLLPRYLDAVLKLDAETGAMRWQLGGRDGTLQRLDGLTLLHPHMSHAFADRLLVFDNGVEATGVRPSRVVEVQVDEATGEAREVWSYEEPSQATLRFLGDARRLPGGNTLISWAGNHTLNEVTPDGRVVWQIAVPGFTIGRVSALPADLEIFDVRP